MTADARRRAAASALLLGALAGCTAADDERAVRATDGASVAAAVAAADSSDWIPLFDGRDLAGWTPKFRGRPLGENLHDTFRVEDGLLKVRYDRWMGFAGEFGHLFYREPFSHYVIRAEYRFVGEQVAGAGPEYGWAVRNNGLMLHAQPPESMGLDQDFPISVEVQLLGGLGAGPRPTANLCTPGTNVVMGDSLHTAHCTESSSRTFDGDGWVRVEVLVLGDSLLAHVVEGDTVLTYREPQMDSGAVSGLRPGVLRQGAPLREGYVALQAETAPIDFRRVELLNLKGCMDPTAASYRRHFVEPDPAACR